MTLPGSDLWVPQTWLGMILALILEIGSRFVALILGVFLLLGFTEHIWLQADTMTVDVILFFAAMTMFGALLVVGGIFLIYDMNKTWFQKEDE